MQMFIDPVIKLAKGITQRLPSRPLGLPRTRAALPASPAVDSEEAALWAEAEAELAAEPCDASAARGDPAWPPRESLVACVAGPLVSERDRRASQQAGLRWALPDVSPPSFESLRPSAGGSLALPVCLEFTDAGGAVHAVTLPRWYSGGRTVGLSDYCRITVGFYCRTVGPGLRERTGLSQSA